MSANKRLNTSYTLTTVNNTDTVTFNTSLVTITGNLNVLGAQTAIETANTLLKDNIIVLNDGETGNGTSPAAERSSGVAPSGTAGIPGPDDSRKTHPRTDQTHAERPLTPPPPPAPGD